MAPPPPPRRPAGRRLAAVWRMRPRSLSNQLALLFLAVVTLALSVVFFAVVPQLESNLDQQRLRDLSRVGRDFSDPLERAMSSELTSAQIDDLVRQIADRTDAHVTLLGVQRSDDGGVALYPISDSRVQRQIDETFPVAARAARARAHRSGIVRDQGVRAAQAAEPLFYRGRADWVALYSRDLDEVGDVVGLVSTRLALAAVAAILIATLGGYLLARAVARRVRRLEAAAGQVAAGRFVGPLPVESDDEVGQLTRAFNEMQERLARLDRARREFIANASHELRTPIFSLGGFAELLQDEDLDPATRDAFLSQMREQIERLGKLAGDLLDLSRLDAGSLELRREPVDVAGVAREVAREFTPAVARHRSRLELELPGEVEAVCDRERVAQIMRILLDNAIRHTPEGARVTVSAARRNGSAELRVSDTGPALSGRPVEAGAERQLFERFYTADAASGSGLGLAIAKELAERMDGSIAVRPGPERTEFTLGLPAREGAGAG